MTISSQTEPEEIESAVQVARFEWVGWLPILVLPLAAILCRNRLLPWVFMWAVSFAIFFSLKWLTWWKARTRISHPAWRSIAFLLAWPGMDADSFLDARQRVA